MCGSYCAHIAEHANNVGACVVGQWLSAEGEHLAEASSGIAGTIVVASLWCQVVKQDLCVRVGPVKCESMV